MKRDETDGTTDATPDDGLQATMADLLRAIEAQPVPPELLELAHRLARALARDRGAEPVSLPPRAGEQE